MLKDKRKNPRLDFGILVLHSGKQGMTKNISLNGTFIKKDEGMSPVGSGIDFSFYFPNTRKWIDVKGVVVHNGKDEEGMGVQFKKIDERNKEFIRRFILDYL